MIQPLLTNTGASNLFMVFGEPDPKVGILHVSDPTTGEIRSGTTDEIASWLVELAPQQASSSTPDLAGSATSCSTRRVRLRPAVLSSSRPNGEHGFFIHMA